MEIWQQVRYIFLFSQSLSHSHTHVRAHTHTQRQTRGTQMLSYLAYQHYLTLLSFPIPNRTAILSSCYIFFPVLNPPPPSHLLTFFLYPALVTSFLLLLHPLFLRPPLPVFLKRLLLLLFFKLSNHTYSILCPAQQTIQSDNMVLKIVIIKYLLCLKIQTQNVKYSSLG